MFGLTPTDTIVVGSIALLLFAARLPSIVRSMEQSISEFKSGAMNANPHRVPQEMNARRTQPLCLAPALAFFGGLLGLIVERAVMGRWGYSGLWAGAFVAVAMLITGLVTRR